VAPTASVPVEPVGAPPPPALVAPPEPAPWRLPADYLRFSAACAAGERATLAAGGDVLLHHELQRQAFAAEDGFRSVWSNVEPLLQAADLAYLNLEGPAAAGIDREFLEVPDPGKVFDNVVYTGYPRFNYHPMVARDLARSGVDVVSTANNHALDRGPLGVDRTLEALRRAKVAAVGTRPRGDPDARWWTVVRAGPLSLAFVACTRHTNQIPDVHRQVLRCDTDRREIERLIRRLAARDAIDAVVVAAHQGKEYTPEPREDDVARVHAWLEAGALIVLGSHPHVLQPWEKYVTADGRETFAIHSLGNFASHQPELERRSTMLLYLGLTRGEDGQTRINGVRYVPLHVRQDAERFYTEAIDLVGGPADSRALTVGMFGAPNVLPPKAPLVTDPHCDEAWRPAPAPGP
jgi:poly-gamma-glutamate synthesis protein (capsule biosynthesis protein)